MKNVYIIEKDELIGLSIVIAESIIEYSEKFYGFRMISRETKRELDKDMMLGTLSPPIRRCLEGLGEIKK